MGGCWRKPRHHLDFHFGIVRRDSLPLSSTVDSDIPHWSTQNSDNENESSNIIRVPSWLSFCESISGENITFYIENDHRCPVCMENYNNDRNTPRIFPCGHTICNVCLKELSKETGYQAVFCPIDRRRHVFKHTVINDPHGSINLSIGSTSNTTEPMETTNSNSSFETGRSGDHTQLTSTVNTVGSSLNTFLSHRDSLRFTQSRSLPTEQDQTGAFYTASYYSSQNQQWWSVPDYMSQDHLTNNLHDNGICPECEEMFDFNSNPIMRLPCGHAICKECLRYKLYNYLGANCIIDGSFHVIENVRQIDIYLEREANESRRSTQYPVPNNRRFSTNINTPEFVRNLWGSA